LATLVSRRRRVHRIPPHVRDDRDTPLLWSGMRANNHTFLKNRSKIFFATALDGPSLLNRLAKLVFARKPIPRMPRCLGGVDREKSN
jgi:hypothetical protein